MNLEAFCTRFALRRQVMFPSVLLGSFALLSTAVAVGQTATVGSAVRPLVAGAAAAPGQVLMAAAEPAGTEERLSSSADPATGTPQQNTLPSGQQPAPAVYPNSFWGRWQARVTATQNQQPHWVTPLVTVTPRLEQEFRTDFVHYHNTRRKEIWNYDNGKGLELIPEKHTEVIVNLPAFLDRSNGESDGFGDISFLLKERLFSRNEESGNAIVTAFLGASVPTGKEGNGSCCAIVTPTLAVGKGFGRFAATSTAGGALPVSDAVGLGRSVIWNNVAQYRLARTGFARFFWPEFEANSTFFKGGTNDGKVQVFGTPGLIFGRVPLTHDASGKPGRLGLTFGAGEQIAMTHFHTANHYTVITARIPF